MATSRRPDPAPAAAGDDLCRPELDPLDALRVGQTLRALVQGGFAPAGAMESCARVGLALVEAARRKLDERQQRTACGGDSCPTS